MDLTLWHANPHKVLMMVFVAKALKGSRRLSFFTDCSFLSASLRLFISVFRPSIVTPFDCLLAFAADGILRAGSSKGAILYICCSLYLTSTADLTFIIADHLTLSQCLASFIRVIIVIHSVFLHISLSKVSCGTSAALLCSALDCLLACLLACLRDPRP